MYDDSERESNATERRFDRRRFLQAAGVTPLFGTGANGAIEDLFEQQVSAQTGGFSDDFGYPTSELSANGWSQTSGSVETNNSRLVGTTGDRDVATHDQGAAAGTFEFRGMKNSASFFGTRVNFISDSAGFAGFEGYGIVWRQERFGEVRLFRSDGTDGGETLLTLTDDHGGTPNDVRVERDPETYEFTCYYDGQQVGTVSDDTYTTSSTLSVGFGAGNGQSIDAIDAADGGETTAGLGVEAVDGSVLQNGETAVRYVVTNDTGDLVEGVSVDASVATSGVEVVESFFQSGSEAGSGTGRIGSDSDLLVESDLSSDGSVAVGTELALEVTASTSTSGVEDVTETLTLTVEAPLSVDVSVPPDRDLEAGNDVPLVFEVSTNGNSAVGDVEIRPDLAGLPEGWSVADLRDAAPDGVDYDPARRPAGGSWSDSDDAPVWSKSAMEPGETQRPELTVRVPRATPQGEATLSTEVVGAPGETTSPEALATEETTLSVSKTFFTLSATKPDPLLPEGTSSASVTMDIKAEVQDPILYISIPTSDFVIEDGSAQPEPSDDSQFDQWEWNGTFGRGDTLEATMTFGTELFGNIDFGDDNVIDGSSILRGEADTPDGDRVTREVKFGTTLAKEFANLTRRKFNTFDSLDSVQYGDPAVESRTEVRNYLSDLSTAVDDGDVDMETAIGAIERLDMAEEHAAKYVGTLRKTGGNDNRKLARRMGRNLVSGAVAVVLSALPILRIGRLAGRTGKYLLRKFLKASKSKLDELGTILDNLIVKLSNDTGVQITNEFFQSKATEAAGTVDIVDRAITPVYDELEKTLVTRGQDDLSDEMSDLLGALDPDAIGDGLPGNDQAAKGAKAAGDGELDREYRRGDTLLSDFEEPWYTDLGSVGFEFTEASTRFFQALADLTTTGDLGVDGFIDAIKAAGDAILQTADTVLSFFGNGSALITNLRLLRDLQRTTIETVRGLADGANPHR